MDGSSQRAVVISPSPLALEVRDDGPAHRLCISSMVTSRDAR
jgi:hypothetical protein